MAILNFSFSNLDAFREKAHVEFTLNDRDATQGWTRNTPTGQRYTTLLCAVGANAAGKTSVLRALSFLLSFMRDSFHRPVQAGIGLVPFGVIGKDANRPSEFEIEFEDVEGVRWEYELRCTRQLVIYERLRRRKPGGSYRQVFTRELKDKTSGESKARAGLSPPAQASEDQPPAAYSITQGETPTKLPVQMAATVRSNVSFISFARQFGVKLMHDCLLETRPMDMLVSEGRASNSQLLREASRHLHREPELLEDVKRYLRRWDLGLADIQLVEMTSKASSPSPSKLAAAIAPLAPEVMALGVHQAGDHYFALDFQQESSGTRAAFVLLRHMLQALRSGGVALIDELDATLHPHMIEPILRLFDDVKTNPVGAQLLCTLQNPHALSLLAPAQVLFVEKAEGASSVYRGDEIQGLKAEHNLTRKYLSGALGAVPQL